MLTETQRKIKEYLLELARREHAAYPQYNGYFDQWKLVRVKRPMKFKVGLLTYGYTIGIQYPPTPPSDTRCSVLIFSLPMIDPPRLTNIGGLDAQSAARHLEFVE